MPIKSLKKEPSFQKGHKYPALLVYTDTGGVNVDGRYLGVVVLAANETQGVLVHVPKGNKPCDCIWPVGHYYEAPSFNMVHWQPFKGEITLTN